MYYKQDISGCFTDKGEDFIRDFESIKIKANAICKLAIKEPCFNIDKFEANLENLENLVKQYFTGFKNILVLGTGGSTLCPQALTGLNLKSKINLYYIDYIDPHNMEHIYEVINIKDTAILVTGKSGKTIEVLAQFFWWINRYKENNIENINEYFLIISDNYPDNPLRKIASSYNIKVIDHEYNVGGRYSIFTNVAVIPGLISGSNIRKMYKGAKYFLNNYDYAVEGAALAINFMEYNYPNPVFMPYISGLRNLAFLYRQLWAESIGKQGKGSTPIIATGSIDQHSQLQLYLDGPKDKWFTILAYGNYKDDKKLQTYQACDYLENKTLYDVLTASYKATCDSLIEAGRDVRRIILDKSDEESLGALAAQLMLESILAAKLLNLNPFDQPAVEKGKIKAINYLKEE